MTRLDERYADLLNAQSDAADRRAIAVLDAALQPTMPRGSRASIAHALQAQAQGPDRRRKLRRPTIVMLAAAAVAILITGSAIAASPLGGINWSLIFNNGDTTSKNGHAHGGSDMTPELGAPMAVSQSACGYTVTVNHLYADLNRIAMGLTFHWPTTRSIDKNISITPSLTDAWGKVIPYLNGVSDYPQGNTQESAVLFDAGGVATTTTPLVLHLTIPQLKLVSTAPLPALSPCEQKDVLNSSPLQTTTIVKGPFMFELTAPVTMSVRTADVNQTLTSPHGTSITLERVVVTPSEARIYYRGPTEVLIAGGPPIFPQLTVGSTDIDGGSGNFTGHGDEQTGFGNWGVNLYQDHSTWTITFLTDPVMVDYKRSWTDSVTFHVAVP